MIFLQLWKIASLAVLQSDQGEIYEIENWKHAFYYGAFIFAIAACASFVRTFRDHHYSDFWNLFSIATVSGFIAVGVYTFFCWTNGDSNSADSVHVAIAIAVGLMGKEADKFYPLLIELIFRKLGIVFKNKDGPNQENNE